MSKRQRRVETTTNYSLMHRLEQVPKGVVQKQTKAQL